MDCLFEWHFLYHINKCMIWIRRKHIVLVRVTYFMPDYNHIVQDFWWQTEDYIPKLPRVYKFLNYWKDNIEATINEVAVNWSDEPEPSVRYSKYNRDI